jgi:hypothetical protein
MRKFYVGAAALAFIATSVPSWAQQSSVKPGQLWNVNRIDVEDGQYENYMDYLTKVWVPSQEFAKSQGWITDYFILDTMNAREGEPDLVLVTRFNEFPTVAEMEKRNAIMNERMKQDDHSAETANGQRGSMRKFKGSITYREMLKR